MPTFEERLSKPLPILLDGATGTELNRRGVDTGLPLWSERALIEAPEVLLNIHKDYITAGAEVITTNTFRTHRRSLSHAGLGDQAKSLTTKAVQIAQDAVSQTMDFSLRQVFVAGSISPLEDCYSPNLVPPQEECVSEHHDMANNLAAAGVDLILIETMNTIREAQAAAQAAQATGLPYIVSFVCDDEGDLLSGESLQEAVQAMEPYNPSVLSVNCIPAPHIHNSFTNLDSSTDLPIGVYANIGNIDETQGWENIDDISPDQYADYASSWLSHSPGLIGGCCGTSPSHISKLRMILHNIQSTESNKGGY